METKVNYTLVGAFVIFLTVAGIIAAFWLSVGLQSESYNYYVVYMDESVSGLSPGAPVKYNGVDVGTIKEITLVPQQPDLVRLFIQVKEATPVTENTRAILDMQGLTGVGFLELIGGKPGAPPLKAKEGQDYPVIQSTPSLLIRLDKALDGLTKNMKDITGNISELFSDTNKKNLTAAIANVTKISEDLQRNSGKLDNIVDNVQVTFQNAAKASNTFPNVMASIESSAKSIDDLSQNLSQAGDQVRLTLQNGEIAVETLNNQVLPQAIDSMGDIQKVLRNMKDITDKMDQNPSVLFRGQQAAPLGPGEK